MKRAAALALAIALLAGCAPAPAQVELTFFDAGKADAILIKTKGSAVLVDAGLNRDGQALVDKLRALGVNRLDALIVTHFDKDHVGGADQVLYALPVDAVYQPDYEKDSKQYGQYMDALTRLGIAPIRLGENCAFELDGVCYAIDVANEADYGDGEDNDFSLVTRLTMGKGSVLLAGDAQATRLEELMAEGGLKSDVLKVPHHGRYNENTRRFLADVAPAIAVITVGDEGAEDEGTVEALQDLGARVLFTRQGDVTLHWDGRDFS